VYRHLIGWKEVPNQVRGGAVLVDLRSREEYQRGHAAYAISVPYEDNPMFRRQLPKYRTLILYCERGNLSMQAMRELLADGYEVYSVEGGYRMYLAGDFGFDWRRE